jgi:putative flippase GtrA
MIRQPRSHALIRQGRLFLVVGAAQLLLDWSLFVVLTGLGAPTPLANVCSRASGAALGFWLNGRWTFAHGGQPRLGWRRLLRFVVVWLLLTAASTALLSAIATHLSLPYAWLAKPLVEAASALVGFFLWRHVVYR